MIVPADVFQMPAHRQALPLAVTLFDIPFMNDPLPEFVEKFDYINKTLIEYGWIISPHMIGRDFEKTFRLCQKLNSDKPVKADEKAKALGEINELLTPILFHPLTRAFFVFRSKELKYLSNFSHHIEKGIVHYLKNDFFSSVHCLLPAIEGSLLAYSNWTYGQNRKPSINSLLDELLKCRVQTMYPLRYKMYSEIMTSFLRMWIYSDTSVADTSFSFLNRHYVLHGMGNANYYSLSDCQRIIMFFDLFTEFLSLEQNINYVFIPEKNEKINEREDYYHNLITKDLRKSFMDKHENKFMLENSNYVDEPNKPDWTKFLKAAIQEHLDFLKELDKKKKGYS